MYVRTRRTLDDIRAKLKYRNLTAVSKSAYVNRQVLYQIMRVSSGPKFSTIEKLSDYLQK